MMLAKTIFWNNRIMLASTKSPTLIVWDIKKSKQQIFCGNILLLLNSCTWVILYTALYPVTLHFMYYCKWFPYFIISWYWTLILLSEIHIIRESKKWKSFNKLPTTLTFIWLEAHKSVGLKANIAEKKLTSASAEEQASWTVLLSVLGSSRQCEER